MFDNYQYKEYNIIVGEVFKKPPSVDVSSTIVIQTPGKPGMCGLSITVGEELLITGRGDGNPAWKTDQCSWFLVWSAVNAASQEMLRKGIESVDCTQKEQLHPDGIVYKEAPHEPPPTPRVQVPDEAPPMTTEQVPNEAPPMTTEQVPVEAPPMTTEQVPDEAPPMTAEQVPDGAPIMTTVQEPDEND